jgi:hypothetical protein
VEGKDACGGGGAGAPCPADALDQHQWLAIAVDALQRSLWTRLQDHVERRFGRAPDAAEAAVSNDLAQLGLAGLPTKRCTYFLRQ